MPSLPATLSPIRKAVAYLLRSDEHAGNLYKTSHIASALSMLITMQIFASMLIRLLSSVRSLLKGRQSTHYHLVNALDTRVTRVSYTTAESPIERSPTLHLSLRLGDFARWKQDRERLLLDGISIWMQISSVLSLSVLRKRRKRKSHERDQ